MQQLNPSEISDIIKKRIEQLDISSQLRHVTKVRFFPYLTVLCGFTVSPM